MESPDPKAAAPRKGPATRRGRDERAFVYRGGVCLVGTSVACDGSGGASDLIFFSHGAQLGQGRLRLHPASHRQILATESTLVLAGKAGERVRPQVLPAAYGRPFGLGELRIELFPSGHLPGAASLLCQNKERTFVYSGPARPGPAGFGAAACETRHADALCLDATFGHPMFAFVPPDVARTQLVRFARSVIDAGKTPVILVLPFESAMDAAAALADASITLRTHSKILLAAAAFRAAGAAPAAMMRCSRKLASSGEALLWPANERDAPALGAITRPVFAFVSGAASDPATVARLRVETAIPWSNHADFAALCAYAETTAGREIATVGTHAEVLAGHLRAPGRIAYALGPPSQMGLFRS